MSRSDDKPKTRPGSAVRGLDLLRSAATSLEEEIDEIDGSGDEEPGEESTSGTAIDEPRADPSPKRSWRERRRDRIQAARRHGRGAIPGSRGLGHPAPLYRAANVERESIRRAARFQRAEEPTSASASTGGVDAESRQLAEAIREMARLRHEGLLSDEEFMEMRAELFSR